MRRRGFTLVELLVVMAIIAVLMALMLPAVQAAREAARRAQCQNNLHQVALAVEGFHAARSRYPPGRFGGRYGGGPDSRAWSWIAEILPYVEQNDLYQRGGVPKKTLRESGILDAPIAVLLCPSDGSSRSGPRTDAGNLEGIAVGQTSYKGVSGANWGVDAGKPFDTLWTNRGTNGSYDGLSQGDGLLWRSDADYTSSKDRVRDGLSNTFMVGEDLPERNAWCSWPYANNAYGTCAIPPNSTWDDPTWWPNTWSFRSNHPGGLQFAFGDGSIRFIRQDVALDVYRALATRAGREPVEP